VDAEEAVEPAVEPAGAGLRRKLVTVPVAPASEERLIQHAMAISMGAKVLYVSL
jgi:hypothetical protein